MNWRISYLNWYIPLSKLGEAQQEINGEHQVGAVYDSIQSIKNYPK